jgi:L-threonylcarbamoyladenylate synthase
MTLSIRDTAYQLRQGHLIALADETGFSIAADPTNDSAVDTILPFLPAGLFPTILIQNTDQLGLYVAQMPDVAFDLVEFADKPLTVVYDQGKNVSAKLWATNANTHTATVAVRRSLNGEVQRLIGGFGRGLLTVPFESLSLPELPEGLLAGHFGTLPNKLERPRIMALEVDGGVRFIRK